MTSEDRGPAPERPAPAFAYCSLPVTTISTPARASSRSCRAERDDAILAIEQQPAGGAVDLHRLDPPAHDPGRQPGPVDQRPRDAAAAVQRARQRRHPTAAVAGQHYVVGEQRL
jgi:hypothetical protein